MGISHKAKSELQAPVQKKNLDLLQNSALMVLARGKFFKISLHANLNADLLDYNNLEIPKDYISSESRGLVGL